MSTHKYGEIKYNVGFNIDNKGLQELKKQLKEINSMTLTDFKSTTGFKGSNEEAFKEFRRIQNEAAKVEEALKKSFNPKIGVSNLTEFSKSIKNIGVDKLAEDFNKLGSVGSAAFNSLNMGLMTTNTYVKKTTKLLDEMATSFKNTVKWGISSSAFNTMTNAVQQSWQYAKALDSSLNDIQIVANKSASDMEKFAQQANKAAQALGASTLDYTKGALIYYQQGLSDEEVNQRTDVTLKMANVLGTSAQEVSNYMTAIWNNFDDGSQSLEHFADVITALGAATASSSEEIATGLEKFAAIGDTVGLSYEYATSALATVVAKTRQSADTVGTAFKTLFARIQDLELGETLDDGTTLGKYAEALAKVGINIKDSSGELKKMDTILEEMGNKWDQLNQAQKVALAQSVAGTRQYSQLMALMDGWDDFQTNLGIAYDANGTLQKQQEIYLESTQAHLEKLGTAAERFKTSLFDKEATNGLIDGLSQVINLFASFNESIGGGSNLLLALGATGVQVFSNQIAESIGLTIRKLEEAKQKASDLKVAFEATPKGQEYLLNLKNKDGDIINPVETLNKLYEKRELYKTSLTEHQMQQLEELIQTLHTLINSYIEESQAIDQAFELFKQIDKPETWAEEAIAGDVQKKDVNRIQAEYGEQYLNPMLQAQDKIKKIWDIFDNSTLSQAIPATEEIFKDYIEKVEFFIERYKRALSPETIKEIQDNFEKIYFIGTHQREIVKNLKDESNKKGEINDDVQIKDLYKKSDSALKEVRKDAQKQTGDYVADFNFIVNNARKEVETQLDYVKDHLSSWKQDINENLDDIGKEIEDTMKKGEGKLEELKHIVDAKILINIAAGLGQIGSALKSVTNIKNVITNTEISTWEKFTQVMMSLGTATALVARGFGGIQNSLVQINKNNKANIADNLAKRREKLQAQIEAGKEAKKTVNDKGGLNDQIDWLDWHWYSSKDKKKELKKENKIIKKGEQAQQKLAKLPTEKQLTDPKGIQQTVTSGLTGIKGLATASLAALKSLWVAIVPFLPMIAIITAAVVALAAVVYTLVKAWNKDADAAKEAKKNVESLSAAYEKCAEKAKALKEAISSYKDAIAQLKELKVGTDEYAKALDEANKKAKELIETYKLYGQYTVENGVITINEEALKEAQSKADEQERNLESTLNLAKNRSDQATLKSQTTNLERKLGWGKQEDTLEDLLGIENLNIKDKDTITKELLEKGNSKDNIKKLFEGDNLKEDVLQWVEQSKQVEESRKYYSKEIAQNAVEAKYQNDINAITTIGKDTDNKPIIDSARAQQITAILGQVSENTKIDGDKTLSQLMNNFKASKYGSNKKLNKLFKSTGVEEKIDNDEDLAKTYARLILGSEDANLSYKGGVGKGTIKDSSGNTLFENKSDKEMRQELANYAKAQELSEKFQDKLDQKTLIDNLGKVMTSAKEFGSKYGTDFTDALLNSFAKGKEKQIDLSSIFSDLSEKEVTQLSGLKPEDLMKSLGLTEETLTQIGYSSANEFALAFKNGLLEYKWDADKALDKVLTGREDEYKAIDLDVEEVKKYSKYLMDIADEQKDLADTMEQDARAATIVTQSIMRMNNGIDKLADGWEEWSDILKKSSKSSEEYYDALTNVKDAVGDLLDISEEYITDDFVQEHMEEIGKAAKGDAESIDKLHIALGKEMALNIAINNKALDKDNKLNIDIDTLRDKINNLEIPDIEVGASMDFTEMDADMREFTKAMIDIVNSAHMTVDEANAFFGQMGFEANFATETQTIGEKLPVMETDTEIESIFPLKMKSQTYQSGTKEVYTDIEVPSFTTNGSEPKINLTRKASGSYNNYSSKNKGGKSAGGDNKPDKMDSLKTEIDRYHKVNTQITKVDNSLKKLQSQQEKFVGGELLDNLNQQWDLLNTQIQNYNEKLRIANEEQAELTAKLSAKGVNFNADGTVSNYAEAIKAQEAYVNGLIDNYNHMSKDAQESYKETVEQAKEDFEQFKTDIDRYDELISSFIPDINQSIQDALDKQIENNIQKFNIEIEVALDMSQATRDWNAWVKRAIEGFSAEDIFGNAQARLKDFYSYFNEGGTGEIQETTKHLENILAELNKQNNGQDNIFGNNTKKGLEELNTYYTKLMQSITDIIELQDELQQSVLDEMDEVQEKFDKQIDSYSYLREIINHDIKIIQMTLGEDAYGEMSKFYDAQQKNYEKQLDFQRQQRDFWYAEMQAAEEGSKEWDSAREKWQNAVNQFNSLLEEGLENAKTKFENAINDIFKKLNDTITGGMGLDYVNTQWDLINKNADRYLDTINATYAIRELEKKYIDSINNSDNVAVQQRLQKVMSEQLEGLKQKDKLTQYDVDRANKLYEIELARIALEESQKNKSQMRLRRDSQGNYSYQYVADTDAISEAEDKLNGLYNDLYNFDKERYNTTLNDIYSIWSEYQEAMAAAALINDPELRAEKERLIQEQYNELMMQAEEDYQVAKYSLQESFFNDWVNLNDMTLEQFKNLTNNEKDIIMTEFVPTWKNGISEMAEVFAGPEGFAKVTQDAWYAIKEAEQGYSDDLKELENVSKQTFEAIANGQDEAIDKAKDLIKENTELINAYGEELDRVQAVYEKVKQLRQEYEAAEKAAIAATKAAYEFEHKSQEKQISEVQNGTSTISSAGVSNTSGSGSSGESASAGGSGSGGNGTPEVGETVNYNGGRYYATSYGTGSWGSRSGGQVKITIVKSGRPYPIHIATTSGGALGWIREDQISGYNTGGYTGSWDNSGKLALLHQKELVLNSSDTKNMLNAVSVMRTLAYSLGSNLLAKLAGASANGINGGVNAGTALEQNVHIDATFPNVRDAAEIEEALNNLTNAASQRIMENR